MLFYENIYYYYEIDISNYKINDIILFQLHCENCDYAFNYQYKSKFNGKNFIDKGVYEKRNFILIKKTIEDSSLIIYVLFYALYDDFTILELIPDKAKEIISNYQEIVIEPTYFFIDYFDLNNINSIGIEANDSFLFNEQEKNLKMRNINKGIQNLYITKTNNNEPKSFKSIIIYINSTSNVLFEVKKLNYPIYTSHNIEYFQLCQGQDTLNELYFYLSTSSGVNLLLQYLELLIHFILKRKKLKKYQI